MSLSQDFRFGARMLAQRRGWTAVSVLALGLGLGVNIAIFSVLRVMLWTPLPYPHPEQMVAILQTNLKRGFNDASVSWGDVQDWSKAPGIQSIAAYQTRPLPLLTQGEPVPVPAMQVSPEFFPALEVRPLLGRAFLPSESPETESRVAIISHALWQGQYRGEPSVLGREMRLDGRNYTIVGVMPQNFQFLFQNFDVWVPLTLDREQRQRGYRSLEALARLQPGVSPEQAREQLKSISERMEKEDPQSGRDWRGAARLLRDRVMGRGARSAATVMLLAIGFVLLIACANVASLMLARGTARRREFAIRASLGAGRFTLMRLVMAEGVLLGLIGGVAGVIFAYWSMPPLKSLAPPEVPLIHDVTLDWAAMRFSLVISLATGVAFGLLPAWLLSGGDLARSMQDSSRGSAGGRHLVLKSLVVAEMALALVLVAAGTLMVRSLIQQESVDPGFDKSRLMTANLRLPLARYPNAPQVADFYSRVLDNLRQDQSLESAALVDSLPLAGNNSYSIVSVEGDDSSDQAKMAGVLVVSPGYFEALRIPLLAGRSVNSSDTLDTARVALVNETFLKRFWPKERNPVGRRVQFGDRNGAWVTVIGLVRDVHHTNLLDPPRPEIYRPHSQVTPRNMTLIARPRVGDAENASAALRAAVSHVDRDQPLFRMRSLEAAIFSRSGGATATVKVLGVLSVIALLLAAIGTYGVMAYAAAQRVREIGIRLALGATRSDVFRMVVRGGLALAALGMAIGLPAAYGVAPLLRNVIDGLDPRDGVAYLGVAALLSLVALAASVVPAMRAMRVDPCSVLREE